MPAHKLTEIVQELVAQSAKLSKHMYGHYVIRSVMEQCPGEAHRAVSLALGREVTATMRLRYGLTFGVAEDQLSLARALIVTGEWLRYIDTAGSRYVPRIARRMMHILSVDEVQSMCDSLKELKHCLKQSQVGRRLLRMLAGAA